MDRNSPLVLAVCIASNRLILYATKLASNSQSDSMKLAIEEARSSRPVFVLERVRVWQSEHREILSLSDSYVKLKVSKHICIGMMNITGRAKR